MTKGLVLRDLRVAIEGGGRDLLLVDGVSLAVAPGQCVALLGESGCGKSLTALAAMRLLPEGVKVAGGEVALDGESLLDLPERRMRGVRGGRLAMIFQEPMTSLNPVLTVGVQIRESLRAHRDLARAAESVETERLMAAVGLPMAQLSAYPFQLSGGQRQRALIAMMLAGAPSVLVADEPTTALDVTIQAQILGLLKRLRRERNMGLLLVTHDLDVARDMADRVAVMYAGQIVEWASREQLYGKALHPYTRRLFQVLPSINRRGGRLAQIPGMVPAPDAGLVGCRFADRCPAVVASCRVETQVMRELAPGHWLRCGRAEPDWATPEYAAATVAEPPVAVQLRDAAAVPLLLELRDLAVHFPIRKGLLQRVVGHTRAVDGVSLGLGAGETLALVGESGCGKTTLARAALRLIEPSAGQVLLAGEDISHLDTRTLRQKRTVMQIVFQDPYASLDPRMRVGEIIAEGLAALRPDLAVPERSMRVTELLERVGLARTAFSRYPHEFSGGQRQRIAIARALVVEPKLLICDEPTSALDVSVQAQILNLLADLRRDSGLAYLFISHNLAVVSYLADRVAVMYRGRIVEQGAAAELMTRPAHPYTRMLIESAPGKGMKSALADAPMGLDSGQGCAFVGRCPVALPVCRTLAPEIRVLADGRQVSCHL